MTGVPGYWFVEPVTVRPFAGSSAYGDVFGEEFDVSADVDSRRVLVRGSDGESVVGESTIRMPPFLADGRPTDQAVPEQSEISYRSRTGVALTVKPFTVRGRVVYVEVTTT